LEIVVTGGCGFIGSNLVQRLLRDGHSVAVVGNLPTGNLNNLAELNVRFLNKPYSFLSSLDSKFDVVYHLWIPSSSPMYKQNLLFGIKAKRNKLDWHLRHGTRKRL